jgi:hypothetical protein
VKLETNLEFEFEDVEEFARDDPLAADEPPKKKLCHEKISTIMKENVQQINAQFYKLQCADIVSKIAVNNNSSRLPQCSKCKKFFVNDSVISSHYGVCKGSDNKKTYSKFECALCHCINSDKMSLVAHLLGHNEELLYQQRSFVNNVSTDGQYLVMESAPPPLPPLTSLTDSIPSAPAPVTSLPYSILPAPKPIPSEINAKLKPSPFNCHKCGHGLGTSQEFKGHLTRWYQKI